MTTEPSSRPNRLPEADVDSQFVDRWSQRSLTDQPLSEEQIASLFEAARWAPSANNLQPWLFVYANQPESLARARTLLKEPNQRWASRAPLLVFVFARKVHPETGAPLRTAAFDTGAAWQALALQARKLGLSTRAMGGIHLDQTYVVLGVPSDQYDALVGIAIGHPGDADALPEDLRARETPTGRKSTREFVVEGRYQEGTQ